MMVKGTGFLRIGIAQAVDTPLGAAALHDPFFHAGDFGTIAGADLDAVRVEDEVPPVELGLVPRSGSRTRRGRPHWSGCPTPSVGNIMLGFILRKYI